jgi:hypothetical protein
MKPASAARLINAMIYKPGWKITATDNTHRFEGTVKVDILYPAFDSGSNALPDAWEKGYPEEIGGGARASFNIMVADCGDDCDMYRKVIDVIMEIELHEAREFLRVLPTGWAPFHPNRADGMKRWGTPQADLLFGVA